MCYTLVCRIDHHAVAITATSTYIGYVGLLRQLISILCVPSLRVEDSGDPHAVGGACMVDLKSPSCSRSLLELCLRDAPLV